MMFTKFTLERLSHVNVCNIPLLFRRETAVPQVHDSEESPSREPLMAHHAAHSPSLNAHQNSPLWDQQRSSSPSSPSTVIKKLFVAASHRTFFNPLCCGLDPHTLVGFLSACHSLWRCWSVPVSWPLTSLKTCCNPGRRLAHLPVFAAGCRGVREESRLALDLREQPVSLICTLISCSGSFLCRGNDDPAWKHKQEADEMLTDSVTHWFH